MLRYLTGITLAVSFLLLNACQPTNSIANPTPTLALWQVQFSPSLQWMGPVMNLCAQNDSGIGLIVSELPAESLEPLEADITLRWDEPDDLPFYSSLLGWDDLIVSVNADNPITELTLLELKQIYSGKIRNWGNLLDDDQANPGEIQVWTIPPGDDIQQVFADGLVPEKFSYPFAMLAPDAHTMRQAIAENPGAIGYLPQRWVDSSIREVNLQDVDNSDLRRPILAILPNEPDARKKGWLACLAQNIQP